MKSSFKQRRTKVYSKESAIWIDGGTVATEDDLWTQINEKLNAFTDHTVSSGRSTTADVTAEVTGKVGVPFVASAQAKVAPKYGQSRSKTESSSR